MKLGDLYPHIALSNNPVITDVAEDSRDVRPGSLFFAHMGSKDDGLKYIPAAFMSGAVAAVIPKGAKAPPVKAPIVEVDNTRKDLARVAAALFPQAPQALMAVTGTSGKTSTTYFAQDLLNQCGMRAVCLGTLGVQGAVTSEGSLTTPTAGVLHKTLDHLAHQKIKAVAMEASSQALAQYRVDGLKFHAAAFTNLSRDHLDYHGTMDAYFAAKCRLFKDLLWPDAPAILNADDPWIQKLIPRLENLGRRVMTVSAQKPGTFRIMDHTPTPLGQNFTLVHNGASHAIRMPVMGPFQAMNAVMAVALCSSATGVPVGDLIPHLKTLQSPPGRMQGVPGHPQGAAVYVDYAHKPDALLNVLTAARAHTSGQLIVVFGCGGDRDPGKRPIMGEIAARLSDRVIITDDNPRSEDPEKIRAAIMAGAPHAINIGGRRAAIHAAIHQAGAGDVVIIAGKGHETGQEFATHTDPFSDVQECLSAYQSFSSPSRKDRAS